MKRDRAERGAGTTAVARKPAAPKLFALREGRLRVRSSWRLCTAAGSGRCRNPCKRDAKSLTQSGMRPDQCFAWRHSAQRITSLFEASGPCNADRAAPACNEKSRSFWYRPSPQPAGSDVHNYVIYETEKLVKSIRALGFDRGLHNNANNQRLNSSPVTGSSGAAEKKFRFSQSEMSSRVLKRV